MEDILYFFKQIFCRHDYECKTFEFHTHCECKKCGKVEVEKLSYWHLK